MCPQATTKRRKKDPIKTKTEGPLSQDKRGNKEIPKKVQRGQQNPNSMGRGLITASVIQSIRNSRAKMGKKRRRTMKTQQGF